MMPLYMGDPGCPSYIQIPVDLFRTDGPFPSLGPVELLLYGQLTTLLNLPGIACDQDTRVYVFSPPRPSPPRSGWTKSASTITPMIILICLS